MMSVLYGVLGFLALCAIFLAAARLGAADACGECPDREGSVRCPSCPFRTRAEG